MGFDNLHFHHNLLISFVVMSLLLRTNAITDPEMGDESSFSYNTGAPDGPDNWATLNYPNWTLCGTGRRQSPINILTQTTVPMPSPGSLNQRYQAAPAVIKNRGHDIEVEWRGDAGEIIINGSEYKLVQCHWHIPSEHTINGSRFEMELHMVHVNSQGDTAVTGILYSPGSPDSFLQRISPYLQCANKEGVELGFIDPSAIEFDGKSYYRYQGSLTTPPCSENVTWTVVKSVRTVAIQQVMALRDAVKDGNTGNARPLQPLNGREVYSYCEKY